MNSNSPEISSRFASKQTVHETHAHPNNDDRRSDDEHPRPAKIETPVHKHDDEFNDDELSSDENLNNFVEDFPGASTQIPRNDEKTHRPIPPKTDTDKSDTVDGEALISDYDIVHSNLNPKDLDETERKLYDVQMSILEFEIKHQKGIAVSSDQITVPGRMSITLCSLLETLAIVLGFVLSFIHFAFNSPNYLLAVLVIGCITFISVVLYDTSYRSQRILLSIFQVLGLCLFMALVDWAFLDMLFNPVPADRHQFMLGLSTIFYSCVPLLMIFHVVYLGRGHRTLKLKRKTTPTQIIERPNVAQTTLSSSP